MNKLAFSLLLSGVSLVFAAAAHGQTVSTPPQASDVKSPADIRAALYASCNASPTCAAALQLDQERLTGIVKINTGPPDPLADRKARIWAEPPKESGK